LKAILLFLPFWPETQTLAAFTVLSAVTKTSCRAGKGNYLGNPVKIIRYLNVLSIIKLKAVKICNCFCIIIDKMILSDFKRITKTQTSQNNYYRPSSYFLMRVTFSALTLLKP